MSADAVDLATPAVPLGIPDGIGHPLHDNGAENGSKKLTPKLTPTAYPECSRLASLGNEQSSLSKSSERDNSFDSGILDSESLQLSTVGMGETVMGRGGVEPPTRGFSVRCSTA